MQQMVLEPSVPAVHTDDAKSDMWRYQRAEEIAVLQAAGLSEGRQILSEKYTEDADPLTATAQYGMWIKMDLYEDKDVDGYEIATRTRTGSQTCVLFETLTSIGLFHLPPLLRSQSQWVTASPYVRALQSLTCRCCHFQFFDQKSENLPGFSIVHTSVIYLNMHILFPDAGGQRTTSDFWPSAWKQMFSINWATASYS